VAKKEKIKIFGFKVRDPSSGLFLSKSGSWTTVGAIWARRHNAINAIKSKIKIKPWKPKSANNLQEESLKWEIVNLVEGESESVLFYLGDLSS
jgi:hypothetical protein